MAEQMIYDSVNALKSSENYFFSILLLGPRLIAFDI